MEIRLKPWEVFLVIIGLLFSGIIIGFIIKGHYSGYKGYLQLGLILLVPLNIIMRRRYKTRPGA
jgi:hypothetical protein